MPSTLLQPTEIRQHIRTGLVDEALDRLVTDADLDIQRIVGPHDGERTVRADVPPNGLRIWVKGRIESIAEITQRNRRDTSMTTVDPDLYFVEFNNAITRRTGYWDQIVEVRFTPVSTNAQRAMRLIDLVRLAVRDEGVQQERSGDYSYVRLNRADEYARIIRQLKNEVL